MSRNERGRPSLYERYDVSPPSSRGVQPEEIRSRENSYRFRNSSSRRYRNRSNNSWDHEPRFSWHDHDESNSSLQQLQQRNRRMLFLTALILSAITWGTLFQESTNVQRVNDTQTKQITRIGNSFVNINKLSNSRSNQHLSKKQQQSPPKEDIHAILAEERTSRKRWSPCNTKYELERHDHEPRHGDICRIKGGIMSYFECPQGCHETGGNAPFCAQDTKIFGGSKPCRARNPNAEPEYRCDDVGVCILAVGSPKGQFKGKGLYFDDTCDGMCGDRNTNGAEFVQDRNAVGCASDLDCSLAGICLPETKTCLCDPWADGPDCSYLKFQPVEKSRLGYMNERHSSWGGSIIFSPTEQMYHMYVSEILCKVDPDVRKRCGLSSWETHSRVVVAKSSNVEGPYERNGVEDEEVLLHPEHHNPTIHTSPSGDWHLFTIAGSTGPIERMVSSDHGKTWGEPYVISARQNPGPLLRPDGSTYLFYRADGMDLPSPTCSDEGIAMQVCPVAKSCHPPNDIPIFGHTGEDPSVFIDSRGNYHMLFNALPYKCVPKFNQGGHAWSKDGVNWSAKPRVGAFDTTIEFTDGTSIKCERRERPQMVVGVDGKPIALVTGLTGCPKGLLSDVGGVTASDNSSAKFYRGGDDSFTLVQLMVR